nr:sulfite exporter TauE/SafE family protein [Schaalia cardiffensis]
MGRPAPSFTVGRSILVLVTGLSAGFLSGLFGVGGGVLIVPALTLILGMDQKRAAATSLVAIIPTAAAGAVSYAMSGNVSLIAMLILIAGALVGAQIGVLLLHRLPERILPWIFVGFVAFVVISQRFHVPIRDSVFELDWYKGIVLLIVGLFSGILSGLVGVGGGSVIVPGMEILVGAGDLLARGTSLLVIIPTAISGTITNARHGLVDLKLGLVLGAIAALAAPVGTFAAAQIAPTLGELLFSCFLVFVGVQTLMKARKKPATKGE